METIIGSLKDNVFIRQQKEELGQYKQRVASMIRNFER